MKNVSVITGGGSGMGFDVARILGKENKIVLVGRTVSKLENAISQLKAEGIDAVLNWDPSPILHINKTRYSKMSIVFYYRDI